jgi:hypothetical protein
MSRVKGGALPALAYYASLEHWLHRWILCETFWTVDEPYDYDPDDERIRDAKHLAEAAITKSSTIVTDVWGACDGGRGCDWWVRKAILAANFESESDARESFFWAWRGMKPWARKLFIECGGKREASPYTESFRLGDFMPQLELIKALL